MASILKTKQNSLLYIVFLTVCSCFLFLSCSSDDDENGGDSRIVGTWNCVHKDYVQSWYFNGDGSCNYGEWGRNSSQHYGKTAARWNTNSNKLHVHWSYDDGDFDDYTFDYAISEDGKTLTLSNGDGGKNGIFTKQ